MHQDVEIRPDIAVVMRTGWEWASMHTDPGLGERMEVVCGQATLRYTRKARKTAFAQAALAYWIQSN